MVERDQHRALSEVRGSFVDRDLGQLMSGTYSIKAFCDMLAGEDYQEINAKYRLDVSSLYAQV